MGRSLNFRSHRAAFAQRLVTFFVPPLFIAASLSRLVIHVNGYNLSPSSSFLLYFLAIPVFWTIKVQWDVFAKMREAKRLGAVLAPEAKGRWPGNIDLLARCAHYIM